METVDLCFISGSCPHLPALHICPRGLFPWISSLSSAPSCLTWVKVRQAGRAVLCVLGHRAPLLPASVMTETTTLAAAITDETIAWCKSCGRHLERVLLHLSFVKVIADSHDSGNLGDGPQHLALLARLCPSDTREQPNVLEASPSPGPSATGCLLSLPAHHRCLGRHAGRAVAAGPGGQQAARKQETSHQAKTPHVQLWARPEIA